jgi:hypothetical protein
VAARRLLTNVNSVTFSAACARISLASHSHRTRIVLAGNWQLINDLASH